MLNELNGGKVSEIFTPRNEDASGDDRPRLVLDTNTVLALWMFRDPKLDALRKWIEAGSSRLYSREDALEELRRVLSYSQFKLNQTAQGALTDDYRDRLMTCTTKPRSALADSWATLPHCSDPDDQKFLEIAAEVHATHLLTRDKALLRLARHRLVQGRFTIVTPERLSTTLLKAAG